MSFMRRAAVTAASMLAVSAAMVMPANAAGPSEYVVLTPAAAAAGSCQNQISGDQHFAQTRCYGYAAKYYRLLVRVCDGRACADRTGPWRPMNSGQWSAYSDSGTWIVQGGEQFGN
ncbi:hypothetical protein [Streptomyces sp. TBY4]|uniref:hypothetical protein n=1 Tax=Streptomyces sp. TBY4 TaxID=2962030 RepID=UPI0020B68103|nr:hypothetical protein [Streptomyces sp. TBY4]MCP3754378.1 hypothetical protein [Streptomyces sp. TBY4]